MTSALRLESTLLWRPTGTRVWRRSDTPRCRWRPQSTQTHGYLLTRVLRRPARRRARSPVLGAVDVQHVGVRVFALHRDVAGRVPGVFPHDAEAVHAGHLGRRQAAAQPGEKPTHLVRQVV